MKLHEVPEESGTFLDLEVKYDQEPEDKASDRTPFRRAKHHLYCQVGQGHKNDSRIVHIVVRIRLVHSHRLYQGDGTCGEPASSL